MKNQILEQIKKEKIIVIIRGVSREQIVPLCGALYDGGIRLVEITFDPSGAIPIGETAEMISRISEEFRGRIAVGAGTVVSAAYAEAAIKAGAKYLISPNVDDEVIRICRQNDVAAIPGAMTPTEIVNAYRAGADVVKVFPSGALGISYLKAVRAPLSYIPMLAVGGVNENNVSDYLKTGVCGVGIGANIVDKTMLAEKNYQGIAELAKRYVECVKS